MYDNSNTVDSRFSASIVGVEVGIFPFFLLDFAVASGFAECSYRNAITLKLGC